MRVAIYARYSSDLQNPRSAEDQVHLCRGYMVRNWPEAPPPLVFKDEALSGRRLQARLGLSSLLREVDQGKVECILVESLDRVSRNLRDTVGIFDNLNEQGTRLISVNEGEIDFLQMGIRGTIGTVYVEDMIKKVRRGQNAKAAGGLFPGGLAYGYKVVRDKLDQAGRPVVGERAIDPEQAKIIRLIFREFAAGLTARAVASRLNNMGVPSARGGSWSAGSVLSILENHIYRGMLVFNRKTKIQGRRGPRYRDNPPEEWVWHERPDLRIVSEPLWARVQMSRAIPSPRAYYTRKRSVEGFGELIRCGLCGSHTVLADRQRMVCSAAKHFKKCTNYRAVTERDVLQKILEVVEFRSKGITNWSVLIDEANSAETDEVLQVRADLETIEAEAARWLSAIREGVRHQVAVERLVELERQAAALKPKAALERVITLRNDPGKILDCGLAMLQKFAYVSKSDRPWLKEVLPLLVARVESVPLLESPRGSRLVVEFKPNGWVPFLKAVEDIWMPPTGEVRGRGSPLSRVSNTTPKP